MWIVGLSRLYSFLCDVLITGRAKTASGRKGAGLVLGVGGAQEEQGWEVILQDSHIDLVLFVVFLISLREQAISGGARRRTLQVRTCSSISCLARHVSRKIFSFACCMCENVLLSLFCWRVEQSDEFAGSFCGFHRFCLCPFYGFLVLCCTRQFVLQCLTGVRGAFDRRHHRCAWGTRSSTRCCSRAVAVIRLQIQEQIVDVPVPQIKEEIVEIVAGEVVCNGRTGVRRQHARVDVHFF